MRPGLVLLTIDYRLGALGFLAHPELARESRHQASRNYGLRDQMAVLRQVRDWLCGGLCGLQSPAFLPDTGV